MKRLVIFLLSLLIASYLIFVFMTIKSPEGSDTMCKGVKIEIAQDENEGLLTVSEVRKMLTVDHLNPTGLMMDEVNTRLIEDQLKAKELIESVECYKAQDDSVHIVIKQRSPVLRVMAENGESYYLDKLGKKMPVGQYSCNLIIATGFISKKYAEKMLAPMATIIQGDDFWREQIEQIVVLKDGSVEMVPRVGEHILYLGQPTGIRTKLDRLWKFYYYGLNEAGWNRYSRISVEFDNQIICKRKIIKY